MSLSPCTYIIQVLLICYANAGDSSPEITRLRYAHRCTVFSLAENIRNAYAIQTLTHLV